MVSRATLNLLLGRHRPQRRRVLVYRLAQFRLGHGDARKPSHMGQDPGGAGDRRGEPFDECRAGYQLRGQPRGHEDAHRSGDGAARALSPGRAAQLCLMPISARAAGFRLAEPI